MVRKQFDDGYNRVPRDVVSRMKSAYDDVDEFTVDGPSCRLNIVISEVLDHRFREMLQTLYGPIKKGIISRKVGELISSWISNENRRLSERNWKLGCVVRDAERRKREIEISLEDCLSRGEENPFKDKDVTEITAEEIKERKNTVAKLIKEAEERTGEENPFKEMGIEEVFQCQVEAKEGELIELCGPCAVKTKDDLGEMMRLERMRRVDEMVGSAGRAEMMSIRDKVVRSVVVDAIRIAYEELQDSIESNSDYGGWRWVMRSVGREDGWVPYDIMSDVVRNKILDEKDLSKLFDLTLELVSDFFTGRFRFMDEKEFIDETLKSSKKYEQLIDVYGKRVAERYTTGDFGGKNYD